MVSYNLSFLKDIINCPVNLEPDNLEPDNLEPDNLEPDNIEPDNLEPDNLDDKIKELNLTKFVSHIDNDTYQVYRYNKPRLNEDNISTLGLVRSIVTSNNNILAFSPPKSISLSSFQTDNDIKNCILQQFVDGTMINLFYIKDLGDPILGDWQISTRSSVGGNNFFFFFPETKTTFRDMFIDAYNHSNFDFDKLDTNLCYSFVLQHPMNRIVSKIDTPTLYFINAFEIDNQNLIITPVDNKAILDKFKDSKIMFPKIYDTSTFSSYHDVEKLLIDNVADFDNVGIMLFSQDLSQRCKIRNPNYEKVRLLRGNQPKIQFTYLTLRQTSHDKVREFLHFYPEYKDTFNKLNNQLVTFQQNLFKLYINCHIKKMTLHKDLPYQFKTHIYHIHNIFLTQLRSHRKFVTIDVVEQYMNSLHPAKLMYSINYSNRSTKINDKQNVEEL